MAFSFMLPNYYGNTLDTANTPPPPPPPPPAGSGNVSATSIGGVSGGFGITPNLSYAAPGTTDQILNFLSDYTYSVPAGGYLTAAEAQNANSYYNKFGGSDPRANQAASALYGYLGTLPTMPAGLGSLALNALYQQTGSGIAQPPPGPSINSILGKSWQGPWAIKPSQFTSTPLSGY